MFVFSHFVLIKRFSCVGVTQRQGPVVEASEIGRWFFLSVMTPVETWPCHWSYIEKVLLNMSYCYCLNDDFSWNKLHNVWGLNDVVLFFTSGWLLGGNRASRVSEQTTRWRQTAAVMFISAKTIYENLHQAMFTFKDNSCPLQGELDFCLTEQTVIRSSVVSAWCDWK